MDSRTIRRNSKGGAETIVNMDMDGEEEVANLELQDLRFTGALNDEVNASLPQASEIIRRWLQYFTPVGETEITAQSWIVVAVDRDEYFITNTNEPIITWIIEGTAEHFVAPVTASALHWTDFSGEHFSKGHWVRGIVGTDIEGLAMDAADPELETLWDMAVDAASREMD